MKNANTKQPTTRRLTALAAAGALLLFLGLAATPTASALDSESRLVDFGGAALLTKCVKWNSWSLACAGALNSGCDVGVYVTIVGWICVG